MFRVKQILKALFLLILPVITILGLKQTKWGPVLSTPQARQIGDSNAKVAIVEYSDFQCPSCAAMQPFVHTLLNAYQGKVRVAYKFYPLTMIHKNSMSAAHAAQCAAQQKKFWPYADSLFQNQNGWKDLADPTTWYASIADHSELEKTAFEKCLKDPTQEEIIRRDISEGNERQVKATPTFFIGDERLVGGVFASEGAQTIERELRK